jgi:hypothetical protein
MLYFLRYPKLVIKNINICIKFFDGIVAFKLVSSDDCTQRFIRFERFIISK